MHELSICRAISGIAERHSAGRPVARVCVEVGQLRQVVPPTLSACWEVAIRDTGLDGAELEIHQVPAELHCGECGHVTLLEHPSFRCETCGATDATLTRGDELIVTSLILREA